MSYLPGLTSNPSRISRLWQRQFGGLDLRRVIGDGMNSWEENISGDGYPILSTRQKRGTLTTMTAPAGLASKEKLAWVDNGTLYYNGSGQLTGLSSAKKTFVSMGAYLCVFPDKVYINTANLSDKGSMERSFNTIEGTNVSYTLCNVSGDTYGDATASPTAPADPENGDLWMDTSMSQHVLNIWSSYTETWNQVATTFVKIGVTGIGANFNDYDSIELSGCTASGDMQAQIEALNGSKIIYKRDDNWIVVVGIIDQSATYTTTGVTNIRIEQNVPDMDFVTECQNRLWGCKYGMVGGKYVNEIYCCALGDFRNWQRYLGLASDSYAASVGSDGEWTGAATYNNAPYFFKEDHIHRVYVDPNGAHQIVDYPMTQMGVKKGSGKSLAICDGWLIYQSPRGFVRFDGSTPQAIGDALAPMTMYDAVAGVVGSKYYVSVKEDATHHHMLVFDGMTGYWHREDGTKVLDFARYGSELAYIDATTNKLMCVYGTQGGKESSVPWEFITGVIGYEEPDNKYISRFNFRLSTAGSVHVYIMYDSNGTWVDKGTFTGSGLVRTDTLPISPRRCDHLQIKITGTDEVKLFSVAKILEVGSDG